MEKNKEDEIIEMNLNTLPIRGLINPLECSKFWNQRHF